jgi:CheY-like chemotaxis protein
MKILIVDDNADITGLLSKYLKAKGYENEVVNDSEDGLQRIKNEKYDFIFLDVHMPEISGLDIIRTLETEKILKDQKIIIFSAHNFDPSEVQDLLNKDGVKGYLRKPIQLNEMLSAINS